VRRRSGEDGEDHRGCGACSRAQLLRARGAAYSYSTCGAEVRKRWLLGSHPPCVSSRAFPTHSAGCRSRSVSNSPHQRAAEKLHGRQARPCGLHVRAGPRMLWPVCYPC
jgi:hypothetical protein